MKRLFTVLISLLVIFPALAQQVNESAYERYINKANYDQMVPGFYLQGNKKTEAKIKCLSPVDLQNDHIAFTVDKGKGDEDLAKSKVSAVNYDGKTYIPENISDSVVWVMLGSEGAIRETIYFDPIPKKHPEYYKVMHLVTNTTTQEGYFIGSLAVNFNKIMAEMTKENAEMSQKIKDRVAGYRFIDYKKIVAEYNLWFQNEYPKRIKYIGEVPDFQALIDSETNKY
ncbi:MAG: hypothetical protein DRI71_05030 [Bacteroidetes bacterium]|nr:MAG: hypothetical protein DRI71_05030 [Bacteroidota bacterium]